MYKTAITIVTALLVILASHTEANAASLDSTSSNTSTTSSNNGAKVRGTLTGNPDKTESNINIRSLNSYGSSAPAVSVYDIWFNMTADSDGDGYYHQFDISFDIDTNVSSQRIYVTGELHGSTSQVLFQTDPYTLSGSSGSDTYQVRVLLTDGYATDQYELALNIYDADSGALLLQYDGVDDYRLNNLYLEDSSRESAYSAALSMYELSFELSNDLDGDGYYTDLAVQFDADAPGQQQWVYARISLLDSYGQWYEIKQTAAFMLNDYSSSDRYATRIMLDYGFAPDRYQLAIELYDADTNSLLLTSTSPQGTPVKVESADYDNAYYSVTVEESYYASGSGGSLDICMLVALVLVALVVGRRKSNK